MQVLDPWLARSNQGRKWFARQQRDFAVYPLRPNCIYQIIQSVARPRRVDRRGISRRRLSNAKNSGYSFLRSSVSGRGGGAGQRHASARIACLRSADFRSSNPTAIAGIPDSCHTVESAIFGPTIAADADSARRCKLGSNHWGTPHRARQRHSGVVNQDHRRQEGEDWR